MADVHDNRLVEIRDRVMWVTTPWNEAWKCERPSKSWPTLQ